MQKYFQPHLLCDQLLVDCCFELKVFNKGAVVYKDDMMSSLFYCQSGHIRIRSTCFHDETLCCSEILFVPRQCECTGDALSDAVLLIHKFNNTNCLSGKCILSYLYSNKRILSKTYCNKLYAPVLLQMIMGNMASYISHDMYDSYLWGIKHKELIWILTRLFTVEELHSFFHPFADDQVPLKSLVQKHYRKSHSTKELADLCHCGIHTFRRLFKKEFGTPVYKWIIEKRAEQIKYRLSQVYIPLSDIIDEFNFSSAQHFNTFCKQYLGDTPGKIRKKHSPPLDEGL